MLVFLTTFTLFDKVNDVIFYFTKVAVSLNGFNCVRYSTVPILGWVVVFPNTVLYLFV